MKYVILSTDNNPDYYSLLPLVCHSWNKLGYWPIIIWLADKELIPPFDPAMDANIFLHEGKYGIKEGVKKSTIAQLGRLFAHEWEMFKPDDILLTSDADMVIASDIFIHDVSQGQIVSYGFDLTGRSEIPICYVKATAAKWRELMCEFTIPEKAYSERWEDYWSVDQQLLTQRASQYGMEKITFIDRGNQNKHGLPTGRWDRHDWAHIPDSIIDVHMKRNSWEAQIEVFERLWPGEDHSFITKFREALNAPPHEMKRLAGDTESLNKLMSSTKEITDAYGYPINMLEHVGHSTEGYKKIGAKAQLIFLEESDIHGFLKVNGNWDNHRPLLLLALSLTGKRDVYEFGAGDGSTSYLRAYCKHHGRHFQSWENNKEWADKCGSVHVQDWNNEGLFWSAGVVFIDHAPGEQRIVTIAELAKRNDTSIIVIHDTEEGGAGDYKFEKIWHLFKYRLNYNKTGGGAGATAVSNTIDLNQFRGLSLGAYTFDND